jgi:hypothetical protein
MLIHEYCDMLGKKKNDVLRRKYAYFDKQKTNNIHFKDHFVVKFM